MTDASTDTTVETTADATTDAGDTNDANAVQFSVVFDDDDATDITVDTDVDDVASVALGDAADADDTDDADVPSAEAPSDDDTDDDASVEPAASDDQADASSDDVAAANAARVNETLALGRTDESAKVTATAAAPETVAEHTSLRLSERLDKELRGNHADKVLKSYPSLALNKVTVTDGKTGHNTLDRVSADFYARHIYAIEVDSDDERVALLSVMTGLMRPTDGAVMNKSLNVLEIEPGELRGHRLGVMPQRYAVREDLSAEQNVRYAMDASGRTFLKPKPVIARELLAKVGFDVDTPNMPVGKLPLVQQRLVAIARAISCDAEVIIADEPTGGLNADDSVTVLKALIALTRDKDPKRCVIVLTDDLEVAEVTERTTHLD
ncbi:ATP-binding cassette domain-containing protein [Bifidobacterium ramosum]|uniref:ATP-binding cassette domain-containing protein n=1 Tax=Bifidobacterium ramosum TaxID=1798158 RepID=A0A7K3TDN2_9BIFI|nr:ATP-binding cassette domain-containing protein [Bifidobacterium ramosum]